ncbi:MAG TPA: hypothetical protein GX725_02535 [Mollicutes bacterium]|nr:hypothetical protein [Mollicutes bacterium]
MRELDKLNHISFEKICKNRDYYVPNISDNNIILKEIIDYCIEKYLKDKSIETYMCCEGHDEWRDTFVIFNISLQNLEYIYSIINCIEKMYGSRFSIGQNKLDNKILLDVRLNYYSREDADDFLRTIKEGLINYKEHQSSQPEVTNMLHILKTVCLPNKEIVFQQCHIDRYLLLYLLAENKPIAYKKREADDYFNKEEITYLNSNYVMRKSLNVFK